MRLLELLPLPVYCPFRVMIDGKMAGTLSQVLAMGHPHAGGEINGTTYTIDGHSGQRYSVFSGSTQIGAVEHEKWREWDGDSYNGEFNHDVEPVLAACFLIFIDVVWHANDTSTSMVAYENNWTFGDNGPDENWRPT